jgi:uncharacterized Rossmann fold enzyme
MIFDTKGTPFHELEDLDFSLENWLTEWYPRICDYLDINSEEDANVLTSVAELYHSNLSKNDLRKRIEGKEVIILAPGVNLEREFDTYLSSNSLVSKLLICADGATSFLISKDIIPDFITTDIDGRVKDQIFSQKQGSIIFLHVHSDNIDLVNENIKQISKMTFIITTQSKPVQGTFNFLGFTDGDRAVCLSTLMNAKKATLLGFDFGEKVGRFSKKDVISEEKKQRKMKKFDIAKSIINWCANAGLEINFV